MTFSFKKKESIFYGSTCPFAVTLYASCTHHDADIDGDGTCDRTYSVVVRIVRIHRIRPRAAPETASV